MSYKLRITNKETEHTIEMDIEDLEYLKELLKEFDETKVDFEMQKKDDKVLKIKL